MVFQLFQPCTFMTLRKEKNKLVDKLKPSHQQTLLFLLNQHLFCLLRWERPLLSELVLSLQIEPNLPLEYYTRQFHFQVWCHRRSTSTFSQLLTPHLAGGFVAVTVAHMPLFFFLWGEGFLFCVIAYFGEFKPHGMYERCKIDTQLNFLQDLPNECSSFSNCYVHSVLLVSSFFCK